MAAATHATKRESVAASSGRRCGGGSACAAGRNAMCAKNMPPTQTTTPSRCNQRANCMRNPDVTGADGRL